MELTEKMIQNKILEISNSYLAFTGKNEVWKCGLSLAEYQGLRTQAIGELERGISLEKTVQKAEQIKKEDISNIREAPENIYHKKTEQLTNESEEIANKSDKKTVKEDNLIPYPEQTQNRQPNSQNSIMDKFEKLKDL